MIKQLRVPIATLAASIAGLAFIGAEEGAGPVVTTSNGVQVAQAYADPAHGWAVPTICNGRTRGVFKGQQATLEQCQQWLAEDASYAGQAIKRCTPVELTQGQYDALTSFAYNVGQGAYCRSTLAKKINAGDCYGAAREFSRWTSAGGRQLKGLVRRREGERAMFAEGCAAW